MPSRVRLLPQAAPGEGSDLLRWSLLAAAGLALTLIAASTSDRLGTASPPFLGRYELQVSAGSLLAPAVAGAGLLAVAARLHERLPWRVLLLASYAASLCWALALALADGTDGIAGPLAHPDEYAVDVPAVTSRGPGGFLRSFVADNASWSVATRQHPPGPVLLLWALSSAGVRGPLAVGLLLTAVGALAVPLAAGAVRSLCGQSEARALVPVLALAPYAVWMAVSLDAVVLALGAALVAAGVRASTRSGWGAVGWAGGCGLLLGLAALFSYSAPWLGVSVICVYFVRRRPLLNVVTGAGALLPLAGAAVAGFSWTDGLTAAQADFSVRVEPYRSALLWGLLSVLVLLIACGPAVLASARKVRATPGWPFLVGAALGVGFAVGAGLARGEVEHSWLPFFPWLLVAAVAPDRPGGPPVPTPLLLVAVGTLVAIVVESVLRTRW